MDVRLVAMTPDAEAVCAMAAKACRSQAIPPLGDDGSEGALRSALASGHLSVAEHASFTFAIEGVSRVLTHQLVRHRLASYSQQSQRCAERPPEPILPPSVLSLCGPTDEGRSLEADIRLYGMALGNLAEHLRRAGVPEEDIRYLYPQGCATNIVVTMNARELMSFLSLRCCERAQWEVRMLAGRMLAICREACPLLFADAGPPCVRGPCPEADGGCGHPHAREAMP